MVLALFFLEETFQNARLKEDIVDEKIVVHDGLPDVGLVFSLPAHDALLGPFFCTTVCRKGEC